MPELKGDPTGSPFCVCEGMKWVAMPIAREIVSAGDQALAILRGLGRQDGKIFALCMIYRPRARKKGPFLARFLRYVFPNSCLQGFFDTQRANLAKTSSFWIHIGDMLPQRGVFPSEASFGIHQAKILPRMSAWESFRRIFCHCRHVENAPLRYPATADTWRTHHGEIMPSPTSGERIMVKSCPRRNVENGSL